MSQQQENPIYWDQHGSRFNITLIFALAVAVLGIFTAGLIIIILGLVMAAYSWLTTPRQYLLYRDSMVIVYGMPRTRYISLAEISHVELLALPMGERLRIRMMTGSRLMLMMRDPEAFRGHLEDALARYHSEQSGAAYVEGEAVLTQGNEPDYYGSEPLTGASDIPEPDGRVADSSVNQEEQARPTASTPASGGESGISSSGSFTETPSVDPEEQARTAPGILPASGGESDLSASGGYTGSPSAEPEEQTRPTSSIPASGGESGFSASGSFTETPSVEPEEQTRPTSSIPASGGESGFSASGSYTETTAAEPEEQTRTTASTPAGGGESGLSSSGSFTESTAAEPEEQTRTTASTPAGGGESGLSSSGSFTESPEPDYSGEGRPAFDAEGDIDTGRPEEDTSEQPKSPPPY